LAGLQLAAPQQRAVARPGGERVIATGMPARLRRGKAAPGAPPDRPERAACAAADQTRRRRAACCCARTRHRRPGLTRILGPSGLRSGGADGALVVLGNAEAAAAASACYRVATRAAHLRAPHPYYEAQAPLVRLRRPPGTRRWRAER
jgi:hypothetical protein